MRGGNMGQEEEYGFCGGAGEVIVSGTLGGKKHT